MNIYHKIKNALFYNVNCLRARWQRFLRGYSYGDIWDMDFWFKRTVKPMLIHLRDYGLSAPNDLYLHGVENEREAWEAVLDEMIACLDFMDEDNVQKYLGIENDDYSYESYRKTYDFMDEKKNRFFELFSKYFWNLWD